MLQNHEILSEFEAIPPTERQKLFEGPVVELLRSTQETVVSPPSIAFALRPRQGVWKYIRVNKHRLALEQLTTSEFLHLKELLADASLNGNFVLGLDFEPFNASFPKPTLSKSNMKYFVRQGVMPLLQLATSNFAASVTVVLAAYLANLVF